MTQVATGELGVAARLLLEIDPALAAAPDCAAIGTALKPISDACDGCHHVVR